MSTGVIWYVASRGQQLGPYAAAQVIQMIRSGQLDGSATVSAPHLPGWTPIGREPTFAPYLQPRSAPAPSSYAAPVAAPTPGYATPGVAPATYRPQPMPPMVSNGKGMKITAWILLGVAIFFLLMVPLMALDSDAEPDAWVGGVILVIMFGIPGAILLWRGRKQAAKAQLVGYLTSRDRIQVSEVARMLKKNELETEQLLTRLNQEVRLDLVFDSQQREYVHRSRLSGEQQILKSCPTCGAPTENQLVVSGERVTCKYCGAAVSQ